MKSIFLLLLATMLLSSCLQTVGILTGAPANIIKDVYTATRDVVSKLAAPAAEEENTIDEAQTASPSTP